MVTSRRSGLVRVAGCLAAGALVVAACSEPEEEGDDTVATAVAETEPAATTPPETDPPQTEPADSDPADTEPADTEPPATEAPVDDGSVVSAFAGETWFMGEVPSSATPADESLEPIKLGLINQENTPIGSYPEVRAAAEAAASWVNAELGGVDGHPIEIHVCLTPFDVEQSQSCALELVNEGVVAFVGAVDVLSNGAYPVIEQNGLAVVGGIPTNLVEQRSPNAFFFSGATAGTIAGFMAHAAETGKTKVAVAYGEEVDSFEVGARDYGAVVGESLGLEVELIPFSLFATDFLPVLTKAQEVGADAVVVLAADAACVPVAQTMVDLGYDAQLYLSGGCAAEAIFEAAGEAMVGVVFNAEGPVEVGDVEGEIFDAVLDQYATEPAFGAGTVGFRGFMNLYSLLVDAGADNANSETLIELARSAADRPSFWGHPYTCDGNQVPGLPALCAPQQVLFGLQAVGEDLVSVSDWIPTDELFADALG